jgi:hypothetical protein
MPDVIHRANLTRARRARRLAATAFVTGVVVAGCGGSSGAPSTSGSTGGGAALSIASSTTAGGGASSSDPTTTAVSQVPGALAFSKCMRANGVPGFPDPSAGGEFSLPAGTSPTSPAFRAAQARCRRLLPGGGPPGPGTNEHPSAQTLSKLVRIARCMREHGVPQFPDPQTTVPSNPAGVREITDFDGAILLFPASINMQAPAYRQALTACGAPPLGLPH